MLTDMVKIAEYRSGYARGLEDVVRWLGFGLGASDEKPEISDEDQEQLYRLFDVSKWLLAPTDYIGQYMAEGSYGRAASFFPTPMHLCTAITAITFGHRKDEDCRQLTTNDPCVGTGRFLLAASNYSLRLSGIDIMWMAVAVTKINLMIFAPWHLIPESFFHEPAPIGEMPPDLSRMGAISHVSGEKDAEVVRERVLNTERLWRK